MDLLIASGRAHASRTTIECVYVRGVRGDQFLHDVNAVIGANDGEVRTTSATSVLRFARVLMIVASRSTGAKGVLNTIYFWNRPSH
jgi:hypothetical protein